MRYLRCAVSKHHVVIIASYSRRSEHLLKIFFKYMLPSKRGTTFRQDSNSFILIVSQLKRNILSRTSF